jgi:hypothetical protein
MSVNISDVGTTRCMDWFDATKRRDADMAKKAKKPKGWRKFDALTRKLIQVPKEETDAQIERDKAKRRKKK